MAYRRLNLPHLHPTGATFSLVFLTADAVPQPLLSELAQLRRTELTRIRRERKAGWKKALSNTQMTFDRRLDDLLRQHDDQSHLLASPAVAQILVDRILEFDRVLYDVYSCSVMSNHVHLDIDLSVQLPLHWDGKTTPRNYVPLKRIVQLIKGGSARFINRILHRKGSVWMTRYRDRFIRGDRHLRSAWAYTQDNPVKAGICEKRGEHPFTWAMSWEEVAVRQARRVYPSPDLWYERLARFDEGKR